MKLSDLEPRWYSYTPNGPIVGLSFLCPHCLKTRLAVAFHRRGFEAADDAYIKATSGDPKRYIWTKDGDSFDNLTLSPSIDASKQGHWHGFIRKGQIV